MPLILPWLSLAIITLSFSPLFVIDIIGRFITPHYWRCRHAAGLTLLLSSPIFSLLR